MAVAKSIQNNDARRGATTVQGVLYSHLIEAEANRLLETAKRAAIYPLYSTSRSVESGGRPPSPARRRRPPQSK